MEVKSTNIFHPHGLDTLFVGQVFHHLSRAGSTNEEAQTLLSKSKPPEGTVISTFQQYAGRGQIGSKWESEPGKNISLSVIFYPDFLAVNRQFMLNQAVSLAVWDTVAHYFPGEAKIKWPNDLYIGDKKAAGILIQNTIQGQTLQSSIVGVGVNVNQTHFTTHPPNPISFKTAAGKEFDLSTLITQLCQSLERRYLQLKNKQIVSLQTDYTANLYRYGKLGSFAKADGIAFEGIIKGTDEAGRLLIHYGSNEEAFDMKEVRFL